jgi:G3E family GTPase
MNRVAIPFAVIGGFLGAGKTTAVNALLRDPGGRRIAVLVNDFGDIAVDAALIEQRSGTAISLTNGCVCCSLVSGLAQALLDVLARDPAPDHIVVEASGVSDPRRIAEFAYADARLAPDATVVLVAADQWPALRGDRYVGETLTRQIAAATLVVQNKADLVSAQVISGQRQALAALAPRARIVSATHACLPADALLGPAAPPLDAFAPTALRQAPGRHAQFATRSFRAQAPLRARLLREALDALAPSVLRAKGWVRLDDAPDAVQIVQVVGGRWSLAPFGSASASAGPLESALVIVDVAERLAAVDLSRVRAAFACTTTAR